MTTPPKQIQNQAPEGTIWFGGPVDESKLSLRIFGESLEPDTITSLLGHEPTKSERKGNKRTSKSGRESVAKRGSWRLEAPDSKEGNLDSQVDWILSKLTDDLKIWRRINEEFDVDLFCGLFLDEMNRGLTLSPETMLEIGQRGIQLGLDIYCLDENEAEPDGGLNSVTRSALH